MRRFVPDDLGAVLRKERAIASLEDSPSEKEPVGAEADRRGRQNGHQRVNARHRGTGDLQHADSDTGVGPDIAIAARGERTLLEANERL